MLIIVQNRRVTQSVHYVLPLAGPQRGGRHLMYVIHTYIHNFYCVCIKYSMAGRGAAARFHHNTNAEHTDEGEHRI